MEYQIFSDKEMLKQKKELVELHKRCIKNWLIQHSLKHRKIKKFFAIYDYYIGPQNIMNYFFRPVKIFITFLICGNIEDIKDYDNKKKTKKRKKKNHV